MPSKRSRAALTAAPPAVPDTANEGGRLCHSLARSLSALLAGGTPTADALAPDGPAVGAVGGDGAGGGGGVYHRFLNSPPPHASPSLQFHSNVKRWTNQASKTMGVGSPSNVWAFGRKHREADEEEYADGRYLLWLVQLVMGSTGNSRGEEGIAGGEGEGGDLGERPLAALEAWHASLLDLLHRRGAAPPPPQNNDGWDLPATATADDEDEEEEDDAGVMWQLLLQHTHLSPHKLREFWDAYRSPQESYEQERDTGGEEEGGVLPAEYFRWPSFFRAAVLRAAEEHSKENENEGGSNKRLRSNVGGGYVQTKSSLWLGGGIERNTDWYPLLGYAAAHAFLNSSVGTSAIGTVDDRMKCLTTDLASSLPRALNLAPHDHAARHSLLAGMAACALDEAGEWTVLDGLMLGEAEDARDAAGRGRGGEGRNAEEDRMNLEVCERMRAGVGSIVDVLLGEGVLPRLSKLARTPLPTLVAESADALLNYSEVHHRLKDRAARPATAAAAEGEDADAAASLARSLADDARTIVRYIDRADPQLQLQLLRRHFASTVSHASLAPGEPLPLHPMVPSIRARLIAGDSPVDRTLGLPGAAKMCKQLEDSCGVEEATKRHCWLLLLERMQDEGALFEEGWNVPGAGVTLANIPLGHVGLRCALDYLANVAVEAEEALLGGPGGGPGAARCGRTHRRKEKRAQEELLCVKDAVRRTVLKLLAPRAFSPAEALTTATELSGAGRPPELAHAAWEEGRAVDVACRILGAPTLYSVWGEGGREGEELEEEEEEEEEEVFEDAIEEELSAEVEPMGAQAVHVAQPADVDLFEKAPAAEAEEPAAEEKEDEVIDLEDSDEEAEVAAPAAQKAAAAEEEAEDLTYPRHYHEHGGNYSESDDYEEEDEEEADRHLAFEGEYESDEGRGDSSGGEDGEDEQRHRLVIPERQQGQEDLVEILDSSEEEEEADEEDEEEAVREETEALNEKVDRYIAAHEGVAEEDAERGAGAEVGARTEREEARILGETVDEYVVPSSIGKKGKKDRPAAEEAEAGDDAEAAKDEEIVIDDSDATKEMEPAEDVEATAEELPYSYTDDMAMADDERESIDTEDDKRSLETTRGEAFDDTEGIPSFEVPQPSGIREDEQPSVLVRAAMSAVGSATPGRTFANFSERDAEGEPADNKSYDNTSAALESTTDNANLWENYDDASQGEEAGAGGSNVQVVARYHGQDLDALAPVLDVHADADDDTGGDESSPEDAKVAEQTDDGYVPDAEATEEEHPDRKKERAKAIDDGYMPDAEATEEEKPPKKEERAAVAAKKPEVDEGYIPDASEASEVDQPDEQSQNQRRVTRDVRFEVDLETRIGQAAPLPVDEPLDTKSQSTIDEGYIPTDDGLTEEEKGRTRAARPPPSIDEGYIPDGALTEEERIETRRRRRADIDKGYLPDGHTTPGETSEREDQGDEGGKLPKIAQEEPSSPPAAEEAEAHPDTRCDDTIDEGYLPSAAEGTEEERSEAEEKGKRTAKKEAVVDESAASDAVAKGANEGAKDGVPTAVAPPEHKEAEAKEEEEQQAMPSVLVEAATAIQQRHPHRRHRRKHGDSGSHRSDVLPTMKGAGSDGVGEATKSDAPMDDSGRPAAGDKQDEDAAMKEPGDGEIASPDSAKKRKKEQRAEAKARAKEWHDARKDGASSQDQEGTAEPAAGLGEQPAGPDIDAEMEGQEEGAKEAAIPAEEVAAGAADERTPGEDASPAEEDFSQWSRDELRAKLKELHLPQGKVKQDMVDALTNHFHPNRKGASAADAPKSGGEKVPQKVPQKAEDTESKAASKGSRKRKAGRSAAMQAALDEMAPSSGGPAGTRSNKESKTTMTPSTVPSTRRSTRGKKPSRKAAETPSTMQTSRRSTRGKKPSLKAAEGETPISALSHPVDSAMPSSRRSTRGKKPSRKAAEMKETPISALSNPVDSDVDDGAWDESQEEHFAASAEAEEPSPGVPTSIVTRKRGEGEKSLVLPVLPEGETVEGSTVAGGSAKAEAKTEELSTKSKRSTRSTTKKDDAAGASNVASVASSTRRSARGTPVEKAAKSGEDEETTAASTRRSKRNTRSSAAKEDDKPAPAEKHDAGRPKKSYAPKETKKEQVKEEEVEAQPCPDIGEGWTKRVVPRKGSNAKDTYYYSPQGKMFRSKAQVTKYLIGEESVPSRRSARKKTEAEETSVPSRRSARSAAKKDAESVSVGTRRSTRSRAKK